jgi:MFS transporter, DHA1 family, putative efflux transporter
MQGNGAGAAGPVQVAAVYAIAELIPANELDLDYIVPNPLDSRVALSVEKAPVETGESIKLYAVFLGVALLVFIAIFIILHSIPRIMGDEPIPLTKQIVMLKKPKITLGLSITFFLMAGYGVVFTYLSPYLINTVGMSDHLLSIALLALGIASLFGSKFGGFSADRWGIVTTLKRGLVLNIISMILLSFASSSLIAVFMILIIWSFAGWSSGATQQYNLATIHPESSDVLLGLNQSMMQLGFAVGAGLGGLVVGQLSVSSITWFGALGVVFALVTTFGLSRYLIRENVVNQNFRAHKRA